LGASAPEAGIAIARTAVNAAAQSVKPARIASSLVPLGRVSTVSSGRYPTPALAGAKEDSRMG
jgi:hypothetical protein